MPARIHVSIPGPLRRGLAGLAAAALCLSLAACVTGPGGQGYPRDGYAQGYPGGHGNERILATVQSVDSGYGRLLVTADGGYGGGQRLELYFDRGTRLFYQGREHPVEGLERGDRISVDAVQSGGRLLARTIEVVQNVRDIPGGSYYGGELQGAIGYVDPRRRSISLTRGGYSGSREEVFYDERTTVEFRGQRYRPEQLEPGDVVRIQARPVGQGFLAERIWVEVSARSR